MSNSNLFAGRLLRAIAVIPASCLSFSALAGTILVPQNHPTIQAAINAAAPGDVIVVAPGTYTGPGNRDLDLMGKAITLRSAGGAATCTIDASDPNAGHHGIVISRGESRATVIDGFTVRGGSQFNGGGILVSSASPTIRNCVITGNTCGCWGAGVYAQSSGASPRLVNCQIVGNYSAAEGGGVFSSDSAMVVENCVIADNHAGNVGAGACVFGGPALFVNCRVTGNDAFYYGGGAYLWGGRMVNCTIANNTSYYQGAAAYMGNGATIANSIIWAHTGTDPVYGTGSVTYSIVQGGMAGAGNRASDPLFVNAAAGDYRVSPFSPAIDAGSNFAVPAGIVTDLAGRARFADSPTMPDSGAGAGPIVDIGAYELIPKALKSLGR
jgi:hypothetical protein